MERLKESLFYLDKALQTLDDSFEVVEIAKQIGNDKLLQATYDSMIQRFEYCYENFWKFLKLYLKIMYDLDEIHSPKGIFREWVKIKLCTEHQGEILIKIAQARNETSHGYSQQKADYIRPYILEYSKTIKNVLMPLRDKIER